MIATPTLKDVFKQYKKEQHAIECIVLAPKYDTKAYSEFIQRIGYINVRSGELINFYCAGYGAYLPESGEYDHEKLPFGRKYDGIFIPRTFSPTLFGKFINELENQTSWEYSGRTEIIILGRKSIFKDCMILRVDEIVNDKIVNSPSEITEMLIKASKDKNLEKMIIENVEKISAETISNSILSFLPKAFENLSKAWKKGKHYSIIDIQ